jgi:tight adherence protein C
VTSDSPSSIVVLVVLCAAALWLLYVMLGGWAIRRRGLQRVARSEGDGAPRHAGARTAGPTGWLARWLALAGYRNPRAPLVFSVSVIVAMGAGVLSALAFSRIILNGMVEGVGNIPGGIGDALVAVLGAGPWIIFILFAVSPVLLVRAARRRRVREIEQDLSLTLELFATLAEAGLGFDAALVRIVQSQPVARPLTSELIGFQRDLQAGAARLQALRHLADRIDVMSMTIFISAVIQSEQVGASLAETLRHQADDLRGRRREQALLLAQALPVKLVFPLVACFLPGIFLSTLGPVLFQMIQVADSVLRSPGR